MSQNSGYWAALNLGVLSILQKGKYVDVGDAGGGIYFATRANGYFQIVSQGRAGGGVLTRCLHRFERGRYHLVRIADYQMPENDGDEMKFLRERNPKEFDN